MPKQYGWTCVKMSWQGWIYSNMPEYIRINRALNMSYTTRALFSKIRAFFLQFSKTDRRAPPPPLLKPSCAPVSVAEYASISLNIPKYPWKCLNNVLTMPEFWIWPIILQIQYVFEDASCSKCVRVLNMSEYGSIYLSNAWIFLNITYCPSIWLSMAE